MLTEKKHNIQLDERDEQHKEELIELRPHYNKEIRHMKLEAENEALKNALTSF